jgi:hypothetical protein
MGWGGGGAEKCAFLGRTGALCVLRATVCISTRMCECPPPLPTPQQARSTNTHFLSLCVGCSPTERKGPIYYRPLQKQLLQNVISGIFPSSTHRVYRLEISCLYIQSCWYFRPSFPIYTLPSCPSPLLYLWFNTPPPPFPV